jgi:hypothetical protein
LDILLLGLRCKLTHVYTVNLARIEVKHKLTDPPAMRHNRFRECENRMGGKSQFPRFALAAASLVITLLAVVGAQTPDQRKTANLEFRLHPEATEAGVPQAFSFVLVNTTGHEIRVPRPTIACEDSFSGAFWLRLYFRPLKPEPPDEGRGCAFDNENWPPILDRIKEWNVLRSGETLTLKADREHLFYDGSKPGTYEFWAIYNPPNIEPSDQKKLEESGIDFPRERLATQHVRFSKTQ